VVSFTGITSAMVDTFQRIPELVAMLDQGTASIIGYIDENPVKNSMSKAIYQMPAGSLLVVWNGTTLESGADSMLGWAHMLQVFVRAKRGGSALAVMNALVDGIPVPGDGQRWRYCPILDNCLPTEVRDLSRLIDEEGIDYYVVTTITQETGDEPMISTATQGVEK
jgi:hypothetical protein